jgi:hypothetical protein
MSQQAERLLARYNEFRRKTHGYQEAKQTKPYLKDLVAKPKKGPDRLQQLNELAAWCAQEGIDPERWIYTMFVSYRWMHAPPIRNLIPKNKKTSKTYALYFQARETPEFDRGVRQRVEARQMQSGAIFDPNRDLSASSEHLKRRYLSEGRPDECIENMGETLGYHPKSLACVRCPMQTHCMNLLQQKVSFNILALRRGDITAEQAYSLGPFDESR